MDRMPRHDGRWRACSWLLLGDLLLFLAGGALVLAPWWLAYFVRSPLVWLLLALPLLSWVVYGVAVLRACAVALPAPAAQGVLLAESDAPALFAELKRLQAACDAPPFDEVYIDGRLNAAIYQTSRSRHVLIVGLPLLALLSPAQCAAILVHEYAHISRSHGRLARWVYRARLRWQALESLHERNHRLVTAPLRLFLAWYVPRMLRETLAFSRRCEQVADALAVAVCGTGAACEAEVALALREKALADRFWPGRFSRAGKDDIETARPFECLLSGDADARPRDSAEATVWVHELLCHKTSPDDTHPSFAERVAATGVDPLRDLSVLPWRHPDPSAAAWLGDAAAGTAERLDRHWQEHASSHWAASKTRHLEKAALYRDLLQRQHSQAFDASDWCRLAWLAGELEEDLSIQDGFVRRGLEIDPEHPRLLAIQGDRLAGQGDLAVAIALWTSLAEGPWRARHPVHRRLSELCLRAGDEVRAEQERTTADTLWQDTDGGVPEAPQPHGLDAAEIGLLCRQLAPVFVHARALWLCRQAAGDDDGEQAAWLLFVQAFDSPLLRAVGTLTGEKDMQRSACERLLLKLVPRLHLPVEVRMLGPRDAPGAYCNQASRIALAAASS